MIVESVSPSVYAFRWHNDGSKRGSLDEFNTTSNTASILRSGSDESLGPDGFDGSNAIEMPQQGIPCHVLLIFTTDDSNHETLDHVELTDLSSLRRECIAPSQSG